MWQLEDTRHEKAIITIVAYVIGFTTAYIGFGLSDLSKDYEEPFVSAHDPAAQREVDMNESEPVYEDTEASDEDMQLLQDNTGFYLISNNVERVLSANKATVIEATDQEIQTNGLHYDVIGEQFSPDKRFVYFCEQLSEVPSECYPFIYDSQTDVLHRVQLPAEQETLAIVTHDATWNPDGTLTVLNFTSTSVEEPWR